MPLRDQSLTVLSCFSVIRRIHPTWSEYPLFVIKGFVDERCEHWSTSAIHVFSPA
jgi:hypothetical protein